MNLPEQTDLALTIGENLQKELNHLDRQRYHYVGDAVISAIGTGEPIPATIHNIKGMRPFGRNFWVLVADNDLELPISLLSIIHQFNLLMAIKNKKFITTVAYEMEQRERGDSH